MPKSCTDLAQTVVSIFSAHIWLWCVLQSLNRRTGSWANSPVSFLRLSGASGTPSRPKSLQYNLFENNVQRQLICNSYKNTLHLARKRSQKMQKIISALGKWGRTQMGSDGFNRILTGFYLLGPVRVLLVPSGPPKHMTSRDFNGF